MAALLTDPDRAVRQVTVAAVAAGTPAAPGPRWDRGGEAGPGPSGDPGIRRALLGLVGERDARVRAGAARALGPAAGDPAVDRALLGLLGAPEWGVVRAAARALGYAAPTAERIARVGALLDTWPVAPAAFATLLGWADRAG